MAAVLSPKPSSYRSERDRTMRCLSMRHGSGPTLLESGEWRREHCFEGARALSADPRAGAAPYAQLRQTRQRMDAMRTACSRRLRRSMTGGQRWSS